MNVYMIVAKGKQKGTVLPVKGDLFLIGSERVCQLRIQHAWMGAQHCAIVTRDDKVFVRDLDSGRPTLVNDREMPPSAEWPLHNGDRVVVGPLHVLMQVSETALAQRNVDEWAFKALEAGKGLNDSDEADLRAGGAAAAAASVLGKLDKQKGEERGRLRINVEKGVIVARILQPHLVDQAEIALLKQEVCDQVQALANRWVQRALLDFGNVERMSSMAIGAVLGMHRQLKAKGITLALCGVNEDLQPVLDAVGLSKVTQCFADKQTALSQWAGQKVPV